MHIYYIDFCVYINNFRRILCDSQKPILYIPDNFANIKESRSTASNYSYVFNQPKSKEEEELCEEALDMCPNESIGNDGIQLLTDLFC